MSDDKFDHPQSFIRLKEIFEGDGAEIRKQFVYAGLLLSIFERFKGYVVDHVDGFLAHHMTIEGGAFRYTRGEKFKALIKEFGKGEPGQHSNQAFRAALRWFHDLGALDEGEVAEIERLYSLRNEIGHELMQILADDRKAPITIYDVLFTLGTYVKVVRWWIKEVEATTDPDMTEERYSNTDWDSAESIDTMLLREIVDKTLSADADWQALKRMAEQPQQNRA